MVVSGLPVPEVVASSSLVEVVETPALELLVDDAVEVCVGAVSEDRHVRQLCIVSHRPPVRRVEEVVVDVGVVVDSAEGPVVPRGNTVFEALCELIICEIEKVDDLGKSVDHVFKEGASFVVEITPKVDFGYFPREVV